MIIITDYLKYVCIPREQNCLNVCSTRNSFTRQIGNKNNLMRAIFPVTIAQRKAESIARTLSIVEQSPLVESYKILFTISTFWKSTAYCRSLSGVFEKLRRKIRIDSAREILFTHYQLTILDAFVSPSSSSHSLILAPMLQWKQIIGTHNLWNPEFTI